MLWLLERMVNLRSRWLQRPYGDQGLLIHRQLYQRIGGYRPLALMEDLDLVERLSKVTTLALNCPCSPGQRWQKRSVLMQAWRNARLRRLWRQGRSADNCCGCMSAEDPISWRTRRHSDDPGAQIPTLALIEADDTGSANRLTLSTHLIQGVEDVSHHLLAQTIALVGVHSDVPDGGFEHTISGAAGKTHQTGHPGVMTPSPTFRRWVSALRTRRIGRRLQPTASSSCSSSPGRTGSPG